MLSAFDANPPYDLVIRCDEAASPAVNLDEFHAFYNIVQSSGLKSNANAVLNMSLFDEDYLFHRSTHILVFSERSIQLAITFRLRAINLTDHIDIQSITFDRYYGTPGMNSIFSSIAETQMTPFIFLISTGHTLSATQSFDCSSQMK